MTEDCSTKMAGDFARKCGHKPKQGVSEKWYGNHDDIDFEATQMANRNTKITTLVLKEGGKLYKARGTKKTSSAEHALVVGDFTNGYTHIDRFTILYKGENERERVQELVEGARVFTIIKKVDTGVSGELSYEVAGFESGMAITEDNFNSNENSGVTQIACSTTEGEEEATGLKLFLLEEGTAATAAWITANEFVSEEPEPDPEP